MSDHEIFRKKRKEIVELQYSAQPKIFDCRGEIISNLEMLFKAKMPRWQTKNASIHFIDDIEKPRHQILVDHQRISIVYEDPDTYQEFCDDAKRAVSTILKLLPDAFRSVKRIGVRSINVFSVAENLSFDDYHNAIRNVFCSPVASLSVKPIDIQLVLRLECGQVIIGPIRRGEPWCISSFGSPENKMPACGFCFDIDSFSINPILENSQSTITCIQKVQALNRATELEFVTAIIQGLNIGKQA